MRDTENPESILRGSERERLVFVGDSFPVMERALLEKIRVIKAEDPLEPVVILVPSGILSSYLRTVILTGGVHILNPIQLALLLASETLGGEGREEIPLFGEDILLDEAVEAVLPVTDRLFPFRRNPGFRELLKTLFKDLRQSGYGDFASLADTLEKTGGKVSGEGNSHVDSVKIRILLSLFGEYRRKFTERFFDSEDVLAVAAGNAHRFKGMFGTDHLFIYSFLNLDSSQRGFFSSLLKNVDSTTYLPFLSGNPLSESSLEFYRRLECTEALPGDYSGEMGREDRNTGEVGPSSSSALQVLRRYLFTREKADNPCPDDSSVRILSCASPAEEVREIARMVLQSASDGIHFDETAVIMKNPQDYLEIIHEVFRGVGIPVYIHEGIPLAHTPEGKSITLFMELVDRDFPRFEVMEFITSTDIPFDSFDGVWGAVPPEWDRITRKAGIRRSYDQWTRQLRVMRTVLQKKIRAHLSRDEDGEMRSSRAETMLRDIDSLEAFIRVLHKDLASFRREGSWSVYATQTERLIRKYIRGAYENLDPVIAVLEGMKDLDSLRSSVSFETFRAAFLEKLAGMKKSGGSFKKGCVNLLSLGAAPGLVFRHVILPGMIARKLPSRQQENPLMYDREREWVNSLLPPDNQILLRRELQEKDPLLISLLVRSTLDRVTFTYPRLDPETNSDIVPSPYLLEAGRVLAGKTMFYEDLPTIPQHCTIPLKFHRRRDGDLILDEREYREDVLLRAGERKDREPLFDLGALNGNFRRALLSASANYRSDRFGPYSGRIVSPDLLDWLKQRTREIFSMTSPSKLEQYHTCPYRFFLRWILDLEPLETPEDIREISPRDRGSMYHRILYTFFSDLREEGLLPLDPALSDEYARKLDEVTNALFERAKNDGITGTFSSWYEQEIVVRENLAELLRREIKLHEGTLKHFRSEFVPELFEYAFGIPDEQGIISIPAAEIELEDDLVLKCAGCIDRIDFTPDRSRCLIIDYKTGSKQSMKIRENCLSGGKHLQLPLYLYSAGSILEGLSDPEKSSAIYYFITKRAKFEDVIYSGEALMESREKIKSLVKGVIEGVTNGLFFPFPGKINPETRLGDHCGYCDYRNICTDEVGMLYRGKEEDPIILSFRKMKEIE